jgi:hypothetical protein
MIRKRHQRRAAGRRASVLPGAVLSSVVAVVCFSLACGATDRDVSPADGGSGATGGSGGSSGAPSCYEPPAGCQEFPYPQVGCAANETCLPANPPICCTGGNQQENAGCTKDADCAPGLACWGRTCRKFCLAPPDCSSGICVSFVGGALCAYPDRCELMAPWKTCPVGAGCDVVAKVGGEFKTDCVGAGEGNGPGACLEDPTHCAPGRKCVNGNCQLWCRVGFNDCPAPQTCATIFDKSTGEPYTIDGVTFGGCL